MAKNMSDPPPYTTEAEGTPHAFLGRVIDFVGRQQEDTTSLSASSSQEAERIRSLLTFTLSMDYQCNDKASLSAPDRDHFTTMGNLLLELKQASKKVPIMASERQQLATYFWKYLHEPCRILDIPPESVLLCIRRMLRYSNAFRGTYEGCCFNVLQDLGLDYLAAKLYLDQRILIPRLIDDLPTRHKMHRAVSEFRELYFTRMYGIEGSTERGFVNSRGWDHLQTIVYDATERGKDFERLRKETSVAASVRLSVRHWVEKVSRCIATVKTRAKEGQTSELSTGKRCPIGWRTFMTETTLPNFFEERRTEDGTLL